MSTTPKNDVATPNASKQAKKKSAASKKNDISNAPIFLRVSHHRVYWSFYVEFVPAQRMHSRNFNIA
jgi:hypothetical protein